MIDKPIKYSASCAILALGTLLGANSAHATGSIDCTATDGSGASITLGVGRLPILGIISATVSAEGSTWTLDGSAGTQVSVGQAFGDDRQVLVDLVDTNIVDILVSLRLHRGSTGKSFAQGGVLVVENVGAYPVMCEEG